MDFPKTYGLNVLLLHSVSFVSRIVIGGIPFSPKSPTLTHFMDEKLVMLGDDQRIYGLIRVSFKREMGLDGSVEILKR